MLKLLIIYFKFIMSRIFFYGALLSLLILSCASPIQENKSTVVPNEIVNSYAIGDSLIKLSIESHGGLNYSKAKFQFVFRDKIYQFSYLGNQFEYSRQQVVKSDTILDLMTNKFFKRAVNSKTIELDEIESNKYKESINSVIYFATLPDKLGDRAAIKEYKGQIKIGENLVDVVKVSFKQEGGGKDFEDVFYYWLNEKTHQIDYLAYKYSANDGGMRFRVAYNKTKVGGVTFQDYVNYSAPTGASLEELPKLYEDSVLVEVSRIETEHVVVVD